MNKSETIGQLAEALAAAQGQMQSARKESVNPHFQFHYANFSAIVDAIKGPLTTNGIAYVQTTELDDNGNVVVETSLLHKSGEWISGQLRIHPMKNDPQGIGSCITYARRYGLQAIVGLDAEEDDDGNAASGNVTAAGKPQVKPPVAQPKASQPAAAPSKDDHVAAELRLKLIDDIEKLLPQKGVTGAQLDAVAKRDAKLAKWSDAGVDMLNEWVESLGKRPDFVKEEAATMSA